MVKQSAMVSTGQQRSAPGQHSSTLDSICDELSSMSYVKAGYNSQTRTDNGEKTCVKVRTDMRKAGTWTEPYFVPEVGNSSDRVNNASQMACKKKK